MACMLVFQTTPWAQPKPETLRALESKGVTIVGTFPAAGGLTAWAAYMGQTPMALYATPDNQHVIAGTMLDAKGQDVNHASLEHAVAAPMTDTTWSQVERSTWIADGSDKAPKIVYVLTDPNCPYCNKLWSDARPWVDSGKVQLLTRGEGGWTVETIFTDREKGHWLAAGELDGRNATDELVCCGFGGRIVMLFRPPGHGRAELAE